MHDHFIHPKVLVLKDIGIEKLLKVFDVWLIPDLIIKAVIISCVIVHLNTKGVLVIHVVFFLILTQCLGLQDLYVLDCLSSVSF